MAKRKNSEDEPEMLNDVNPNRNTFQRQISAREDSPKFNKNKINMQSTYLPNSHSGNLSMSMFDKSKPSEGAGSIMMSSSNLKNFSVMNVSNASPHMPIH
jgi:hypothetical protein